MSNLLQDDMLEQVTAEAVEAFRCQGIFLRAEDIENLQAAILEAYEKSRAAQTVRRELDAQTRKIRARLLRQFDLIKTHAATVLSD